MYFEKVFFFPMSVPALKEIPSQSDFDVRVQFLFNRCPIRMPHVDNTAIILLL